LSLILGIGIDKKKNSILKVKIDQMVCRSFSLSLSVEIKPKVVIFKMNPIEIHEN